MRRIGFTTIVAMLLTGVAAFGQSDQTVSWISSSKQIEGNKYQLVFTGTIQSGYHTYSVTSKTAATTIELEETPAFTLDGTPYDISKTDTYEGEKVFFDKIVIAQNVILKRDKADIQGTIQWRSCQGQNCISPEYYDFKVSVQPQAKVVVQQMSMSKPADKEVPAAVTEESQKASGSLWALIIQAILWGFAMLLTPCVFPMVPMTVSFFLKNSQTKAGGRFKAFMYGLFIVLLYTVPISLIILITWMVGGHAVTADIFNWIATHWLPNILFFIIFMVFAASFFGAFEITLPSSLVNKSDKNSDKKGLLGVFFMALTLVLVSFSCTGPIVGSVLIQSTEGEFWTPMVTMLAFSIAFALPFTIFAMFPSLLNNLKSGSWLNSVKVVLGFIEVALGFKFLSTADMTYHWGILDREVYLAIWIVVFTLLGFYLLGKIRFANDDKVEHIGIFRLILVIVDFTFVIYMIPGMFGAPLKAISGYLPPIETQDFILGNYQSPAVSNVNNNTIAASDKATFKLPYGLKGFSSLDEGLAEANKVGKPVFVDITGFGCTNCREMEARVWSDPKVLSMLQNEFIIVALSTDDKTKIPENERIKDENGKVLKDYGRLNSYIVRTKFGVNAQPNYALLSPTGTQLVPIRGYNLNVDGFVKFLQSGLDAYNSNR